MTGSIASFTRRRHLGKKVTTGLPVFNRHLQRAVVYGSSTGITWHCNNKREFFIFPRISKCLYEYAVGAGPPHAFGRRTKTSAAAAGEGETEYGKTLVELVIRRLKDQGY
jgi:hypothetical protein